MRVIAPSVDNSIGGQAQGRVDKDGKFTITGVQAGHASHPARAGSFAGGR